MTSKRNRTSFDTERARLAGLRSAEARARRRLAAEQKEPPPAGGNRDGGYPLDVGPTNASKVSEPRDLHKLSEDALVDLLNSPSETARVNAAKILHERSTPKAEPVPDRQPRAHGLLDILRLAARAGLTVDEDSVLGALREGKAARDAERAVEDSSARAGLEVMNEPDDVPAASTADAESVGGLRRALGSDPA